jgi:RimJ/RimL family protein N-acetyltransferase
MVQDAARYSGRCENGLDSGLVATRIYDSTLIKQVMREMVEEIAEDGYNFEQFKPDVNGESWVAIHDSSEIKAIYNFHAMNSSTLMIHSHVLKKFRNSSLVIGQEALKYFSTTGYHKLIAEVPANYRHIRIYLLKLGFRFEGINRESYLKNGQYIDQHRFGIVAGEI